MTARKHSTLAAKAGQPVPGDDIDGPTARAWIDLLQASFIVYLLPPWHTNTGKRLVKSPKLYFKDVGLACWLLPAGGKLHAIEIKAGVAIHPYCLEGPKTFTLHHPRTVMGGNVIYDGFQGQHRGNWPVYSSQNLLSKK